MLKVTDLDLLCITAIEAARSTEEAKFLEQLADMEHKMNEARREHTKAGLYNCHQNHDSVVNTQLCVIVHVASARVLFYSDFSNLPVA